jgi:hypothetical protein
MIISTADCARNIAPIYPRSVHAYIDWFQVSLPYPPPDERSMAWLRRQCRHLWPEDFSQQLRDWQAASRQLYSAEDRRKRRHWRWWTLQMHQPSLQGIQRIRNIRGASLNVLEIALDWIFETAEARDEARAFHDAHAYKRYLRADPCFFSKPDDPHRTRYTNHEGSATNFRTYSDRPCKLTGEPFCLHNEYRIKGTPSLHRYGLTLDVNFPQFWQVRPFLFEPDLPLLGHMINNIPARKRKFMLKGAAKINHDRLIGGMAFLLRAQPCKHWSITTADTFESLTVCSNTI